MFGPPRGQFESQFGFPLRPKQFESQFVSTEIKATLLRGFSGFQFVQLGAPGTGAISRRTGGS